MPNIIEISSLFAPELDAYARLTQAQLRARQEPEQGIFIAEGLTVIGHALDAGCVPLSLLVERRHISGKASGVIPAAVTCPSTRPTATCSPRSPALRSRAACCAPCAGLRRDP